jgi:hypothetical protein
MHRRLWLLQAGREAAALLSAKVGAAGPAPAAAPCSKTFSGGGASLAGSASPISSFHRYWFDVRATTTGLKANEN